MKKSIALVISLIISTAVFAQTTNCTSPSTVLCSGTHTLGTLTALYTGCQKNSGGGYVDANLEVVCNENFGSGSGTALQTTTAQHLWAIINNTTKQSIFHGSAYDIPQNGGGFVCNLSCTGTGASSPYVYTITHYLTLCQAYVGTPYYASHTVYYGDFSIGTGWSQSNTISSNVCTP